MGRELKAVAPSTDCACPPGKGLSPAVLLVLQPAGIILSILRMSRQRLGETKVDLPESWG